MCVYDMVLPVELLTKGVKDEGKDGGNEYDLGVDFMEKRQVTRFKVCHSMSLK